MKLILIKNFRVLYNKFSVCIYKFLFGGVFMQIKNFLSFKTILISLIVLFLLVFNVFPMCYLIFKSFTGEGGFTLEAFRRIYTHALNWNALRNTLLTAGLSMILWYSGS